MYEWMDGLIDIPEHPELSCQGHVTPAGPGLWSQRTLSEAKSHQRQQWQLCWH